jgi:hypothetical protein
MELNLFVVRFWFEKLEDEREFSATDSQMIRLVLIFTPTAQATGMRPMPR